MNINRHNYEEYFLLYIDNELTVQQRNAVEVFVQLNPDLDQELILLKESILPEVKITFNEKEGLMKHHSLNADLQEKLLMFIDGELDKGEGTKFFEQLENDAALKNEFDLLQQTKLTIDQRIVFEDKASLYKKEDLKLVAMRWWKIAAAAMLIGAGLWGAVNYFQNNAVDITTATATANNNPIFKAGNTEIKDEVSNVKVNEPNTFETNKGSNNNDVNILAVKETNNTQVNKSIKENNAIVKHAVVVETTPPSNNLPKPYSENFNNDQRNKNDVASVPTVKQDVQSVIDNSTNIVGGNTIASNASFTENNKANNNITYGFDEEEDQPKRNKVGGFFKKLNRVLQRNTKLKTNSDKSINVANLSFAIQ
jgi:hypothetical protein